MLITVCPAKYYGVLASVIRTALRDLEKTPDFAVDESRRGDLVIVVAEMPTDSARLERVAGELLTEEPV